MQHGGVGVQGEEEEIREEAHTPLEQDSLMLSEDGSDSLSHGLRGAHVSGRARRTRRRKSWWRD